MSAPWQDAWVVGVVDVSVVGGATKGEALCSWDITCSVRSPALLLKMLQAKLISVRPSSMLCGFKSV